MIRVLLILGLTVSGCATTKGIVKGLGQCAAGNIPLIKEAISSGGANWLDLVFTAIECVPAVVAAIDAEESKEVISNAGTLTERTMKRQRLDTAISIYNREKALVSQ